ncbi:MULTISPECIES: hypothetical protein [unclassified Mesorhizobium]|uniref:hypothetical protein n=1 Tax=unclassified Mesorhizobium TaxID=325217 RepID=UPI0003CE030E|nr:hypothetical protein [Mesorhizobium sp. LSHC420B00]ESX68792.1 hypothetical protein X759_24530 [Mesorhizobium sp. LSHC420B00]
MKSWTDRLNTPGINGITPSPRTIADVVEGQPMLVPTARQVDAFICAIPEGMDMDIRALRTALAIEHGAEVTCPVTIGYHLRTVAEAANEDLERGMALGDIAPFWRVLDASTPTTRKLSFGAASVAAQRKREGLEQ